MFIHQEGDFQLGADAVGAGDQHRLLDAGEVKGDHPAEAADFVKRSGGFGAGDMGLHQFDRFVTGGDVDARRLVAFAVTFHQILPFMEGVLYDYDLGAAHTSFWAEQP